MRVADALCPDNLEYSLLLTDIVQLDVYVGSGVRGPTGDLFAGSRFALGWWDVPERPQHSSRVEPVHPVKGGPKLDQSGGGTFDHPVRCV